VLVVILDSRTTVSVSYFGATGGISLGVALLRADMVGGLVVGIAAAARVPLRRTRMQPS